jgi:hypothetical protein
MYKQGTRGGGSPPPSPCTDHPTRRGGFRIPFPCRSPDTGEDDLVPHGGRDTGAGDREPLTLPVSVS